MFLYRPSSLLHIKIIQGFKAWFIVSVPFFLGGGGGWGWGGGGTLERASLVLEKHYSPALQSLRISAFFAVALNIVIKNKYTHNFTKNTPNIISNAVCTAGNTGVLSVLNQFLLWARDNGVLSCGSGLYLTSETYSASGTSVEENIASVTDVHKSSENNMLMTF